MKEKYYNQIRSKNITDIEEAEKIIEDMRQEKWEEYKDDFTNLETASVVALKEIHRLRHEFEKQEGENAELKKENENLKKIYLQIARNLEKNGKTEVANYMLAQIEAVPTWTVQ